MTAPQILRLPLGTALFAHPLSMFHHLYNQLHCFTVKSPRTISVIYSLQYSGSEVSSEMFLLCLRLASQAVFPARSVQPAGTELKVISHK